MSNRKPIRTPRSTEYTPATGKSVVYSLEVVLPIGDTGSINDVVDYAQQLGGCVITARMTVSEEFDEACMIMSARALKEAS